MDVYVCTYVCIPVHVCNLYACVYVCMYIIVSTIWIQVPCFVQWSCKVVLEVQLRGLGVALVGFHIPWGPATWPWCGLGWISHSQ